MDSSDDQKPCTSSPPSRVKIAGAWCGVLELSLDEWTVPMLRAEISRRLGGDRAPAYVKLISGGKVLMDESGTLLQAGVKENGKVLATYAEPASPKMAAEEKRMMAENINEEERTRRLSRIRAAAEKLARRHSDGSMPLEDYNIELEDQNGKKVMVGTENDQRGLMIGLMLHANAKMLIKKQNYKDALDVLAMGEEAFSLCDPKVIEMVDNVPILQIDMVWCYFMLRDVSWLSMAGIRLANARRGFERSHGKDSSRFRLLQAGRHAELALYLRLELLEGVVSYHTGHIEKSRQALTSARAKCLQLQVPDETLSLLISMGYKEHAAKRALRMNNQDVSSAVDFLLEERAKRSRRRKEDIRRNDEIREQKNYGLTPQKKVVNIERLNELVSIGFERILAAEALRVNENDIQKALDDLTDPETNSKLQLQLEHRKNQREGKPQEDIDSSVSMGNGRPNVEVASRVEEAGQSGNDIGNDNAASSSGNNVNMDMNSFEAEERDVEMEDEIARELTGDPFSDYDIEVNLEGEAIMEYLSLIESATDVLNASQ